jgi:hypothetical protein
MKVAVHTINVSAADSQTDPCATHQIRPEQCWPYVLCQMLNEQGYSVRARNFGRGGDTTGGCLSRADVIWKYDVPAITCVYVAVNDPGTYTTLQTQTQTQAIIKAAKFQATGASQQDHEGNWVYDGNGLTVAGQASLPAAGVPGQRWVVLADTSSTGGAAKDPAFPASQHTTITGAGGSNQTVWEFRNASPGEKGWGRVAVDNLFGSGSPGATVPWFITRIPVLSTNYINSHVAINDTPSTPWPQNATLRGATLAAANAEAVTNVDGSASVVYIDLYNFQRDRIVAGTDPDFSSVAYDQTQSWHIADNNQHHNAYGHVLVAKAVLNPTRGIPAATLATWLTALK